MKRGSATPLGQARASDFEIAISRFESSRPSQAVVQLEIVAPKIPEMPANGAFLQWTLGLYTPSLNNLRAKSPIVSGE
jgi:hypothetical protein